MGSRKLEGSFLLMGRKVITAILNHLIRVNAPQPTEPLFSHTVTVGTHTRKQQRRALTASAMHARLKTAAAHSKVDLPPGHSSRIGSLLWYILNGMPFAEAMVKGCWQSLRSFHLYLRKHAQVLAPFLQDKEPLYAEPHRRILDIPALPKTA